MDSGNNEALGKGNRATVESLLKYLNDSAMGRTAPTKAITTYPLITKPVKTREEIEKLLENVEGRLKAYREIRKHCKELLGGEEVKE